MGGPLAKDFRNGGSPTMTENVHGGGLRPMSVFRDGGVCNGAGQNRRGGAKNDWESRHLGPRRGHWSALKRAVPPLCTLDDFPCSVSSLRRFSSP